MQRKKLFVTGAAGMIGSYVSEVFSDLDLTLTDVTSKAPHIRLDVEDEKAVRKLIKEANPDYVLHLAAATDVDRCELEPDWAYRINATGTKNVVNACKEIGAIMIYVSTGAVFSGDNKNPYMETDKPRPSNKYGAYKYKGEKIVEEYLKKFYIIRASWVIGGGRTDKKFVGKIVHRIMSGEKQIKVINDKFGSITYAKDLLCGIKELIKTDRFGIYHMTNGGMYSRYDLAKEIVDILGKKDVQIIAITSREFSTSAPRGQSEALKNYNLNLINLNCMRPWKEVLREYIINELLVLYDK